MITMTATEFKAKCLALFDKVEETGESIQITKRGKVVAKVIPLAGECRKGLKAGFAKGKMKILGDVMAPIDVEWNVLKDPPEWEPEINAD